MGYVASNAHVQGSKYADVIFAQAKGIAAYFSRLGAVRSNFTRWFSHYA
jgi:hypothetical protein